MLRDEKHSISRRDFLKNAGLIAGGATVGSLSLINACSSEAPATTTRTVTVTSPGNTITVTTTKPSATQLEETETSTNINYVINGEKYALAVEPNWTLRDALRDRVGLTSIKDMCNGQGACGSCSVVLDGRPVLSCMLLAIEYDGATIETAESIADSYPELAQMYVKHHCMQCGYCTPGFLVTAKTLLERHAKPTVEQIKEALSGNLCRCATYPAHVKAITELTGGE